MGNFQCITATAEESIIDFSAEPVSKKHVDEKIIEEVEEVVEEVVEEEKEEELDEKTVLTIDVGENSVELELEQEQDEDVCEDENEDEEVNVDCAKVEVGMSVIGEQTNDTDDSASCTSNLSEHTGVSLTSHASANSFLDEASDVEVSRTTSNLAELVSESLSRRIILKATTSPSTLIGWEVMVKTFGVGIVTNYKRYSSLRGVHSMFAKQKFSVLWANGRVSWVSLHKETFLLLRKIR